MDNNYRKLIEKFRERIKEGEILAPYTTYKVGGPADVFFNATTGTEFADSIIAARNSGIPFLILGGGSNILVGDKGFRGLVIKNSTADITIRGMKGKVRGLNTESKVYLEVDSGVPMNKLVRYTIGEGLAGLEMHLGLPGTVGGAIYMNSKWTKPTAMVGDAVYKAVVLTKDNELKQVDKDYFHFSYGTSVLQKNTDILIRVTFALMKDNPEVLWQRANESIAYRRETQPQGVHTAGCVFKNITPAQALTYGTPDHTTSAGFLLDKSGCKGMKVGGAEVSPVHANFIITSPGATASDVVELIDMMKKNVKKKFGVTLKEEIVKVGEFE